MTYDAFVDEIRRSLDFDIPAIPVMPEVCESCGNPPHKGRCKGYALRAKYTLDGQELCYKNGSMIALLWDDFDNWNRSSDRPPNVKLMLKWEVGQHSGNRTFQTGEIEPHWEHLDKILEHFTPTITYLKYKALERLVIVTNYSLNEHYGNSTDYAIRFIPLETLWEFLNDNNLLAEVVVPDVK